MEVLSEVPTQRPSVLVIENDQALQTFLRMLLRRCGFDVESVTDGDVALQRLAGREYNVIILDLMIGGTDGFELLQRLSNSADSKLRRVIVATGVTDRLLRNIDEEKIFAVVRKPFDVREFAEIVSRCASQSLNSSTALDAAIRRELPLQKGH